MRFLIAVALTALIASPSVAADRDAERIVTRHVASIVPPDGAGGVAVALRIEGRSLFFNYGWADRANKQPITPDTLFNLASLRKVFEATLLAQAVRNGDLGLDDPVVTSSEVGLHVVDPARRRLPEFEAKGVALRAVGCECGDFKPRSVL